LKSSPAFSLPARRSCTVFLPVSLRRDIRIFRLKQRGLPIHIVTGVGSHRFTGLFVAWLLNYSDDFFHHVHLYFKKIKF
jgi:hypothetical protein